MAISTPTLIANTVGTASGSGMTTSADAPAGSLIVVVCGPNQNSAPKTVSSVQDSKSNSYSAATNSNFASNPNIYNIGIFASINTANDLPSGSTITVNLSDSENYWAVAFYVSGCNGGVDAVPTPVEYTTATHTTSISSGTLNVANELIVTGQTGGPAQPGWTEGAGFTALGASTQNPNDTDAAYQIVSSTSSVTYSTSWSSSNAENASLVMASFKATSGTTTTFTASAGSYSITGDSITDNLEFVSSAGSYSMTGDAITDTLELVSSPGTYSITSDSITDTQDFVVSPGVYSISGDVTSELLAASVSAGSYSLTGTTETYTLGVSVSAGQYLISGFMISSLGSGTIDNLPFIVTLGRLKSF